MMLKKLVPTATLAVAAVFGVVPAAQAQISGDVIKIGFITDLSGLYADIDGPAGAEAIGMAIADMGGSVAGKKIEVLVADHQNKPDVAAAGARPNIAASASEQAGTSFFSFNIDISSERG